MRLTVISFVGFFSFWASIAFAQADPIVVSPTSPTTVDPLIIMVSGGTPSSPASVVGSSYEITGGLVRVDALVEHGPWQTPDGYSFVIEIPPLPAGHYTIEYWATLDPGSGPFLAATTVLQVHETPIPDLSILGRLSLILLIAILGVALSRTKS